MKTEKVMQHLIGLSYKEIVAELNFEQDYGDCCGYADVTIEDALNEIEQKECAKLVDAVKITYESVYEGRVVVNFVFDLGEQKGLILGYDLTAGSGSGWAYGAFCTLRYKDEVVAEVSW